MKHSIIKTDFHDQLSWQLLKIPSILVRTQAWKQLNIKLYWRLYYKLWNPLYQQWHSIKLSGNKL